MSRTLIGIGSLGWFRFEEQTHRWGAVTLSQVHYETTKELVGKNGSLEAIVRARGETYRGRKSSNVPLGGKILLGEGELFLEDHAGMISVGVVPSDCRNSYWLSVEALKKTRGYIVELWFLESPTRAKESEGNNIANIAETSRLHHENVKPA